MRQIFFLIIILVLATFSFAQEAQKDDWIRLETVAKEITFEIPQDFSYSFDKLGFNESNPKNSSESVAYTNLRAITSYEKETTMFFESYETNFGKKGLPFFLKSFVGAKYSNFKFEEFDGIFILDEKVSFTTFCFISTEKNTYMFAVGTREKSSEAKLRFLSSIKVNGKNLFDNASSKFPNLSKIISIASLQETPSELFYDIKIKQDKKDKKKKSTEPKIADSKPIDSKIISVESDTKSLAMLFIPKAAYTDDARRSLEQGIVTLKVEMLANGHIGKITVIKGLKGGLVENAIRVAKRIRFIPALQENVPVTVTKAVQYRFTVY